MPKVKMKLFRKDKNIW